MSSQTQLSDIFFLCRKRASSVKNKLRRHSFATVHRGLASLTAQHLCSSSNSTSGEINKIIHWFQLQFDQHLAPESGKSNINSFQRLNKPLTAWPGRFCQRKLFVLVWNFLLLPPGQLPLLYKVCTLEEMYCEVCSVMLKGNRPASSIFKRSAYGSSEIHTLQKIKREGRIFHNAPALLRRHYWSHQNGNPTLTLTVKYRKWHLR